MNSQRKLKRGYALFAFCGACLFLSASVRAQSLLDTITGFTPNLGVSNSTGAPGRNIAGGITNVSYSVPLGYIPSQATDTPISTINFLGFISSADFDSGLRPAYTLALGQQSGLFASPPVFNRFAPSSVSITEVTRFQSLAWVEVLVQLGFTASPNLKASGGVETLTAIEASFFGASPSGILFASERGIPALHPHGTVFQQNITTPSQGRYFGAGDLGDYLLMQVNGSAGVSVPETGTLWLLSLGLMGFGMVGVIFPRLRRSVRA
jgi:hypothetical protein